MYDEFYPFLNFSPRERQISFNMMILYRKNVEHGKFWNKSQYSS